MDISVGSAASHSWLWKIYYYVRSKYLSVLRFAVDWEEIISTNDVLCKPIHSTIGEHFNSINFGQ